MKKINTHEKSNLINGVLSLFQSVSFSKIKSVILFVFVLFLENSWGVGPMSGSTYRFYKKGEMEAHMKWEYMKVNSQFNENMDLYYLDSLGGYFRSQDMTLDLRYCFDSYRALRLGMNVTSVDLESVKINSKSGFDNVWLGGEYKVKGSHIDTIFDGQVELAITQNNLLQSEAVINDGANALDGRFILQKQWNHFIGNIFGGYHFRDHGLSDYFPLGAELHWGRDGWIVGGVLKGALLGMPDDNYTSTNSERTVLLRKVNGGALKYYSTNPEWLTGELDVKYKLTNQFAFSGGFGSVFLGRNFIQGLYYFAGLDLQWPVFLDSPKGQSEVQKEKVIEFKPDFGEKIIKPQLFHEEIDEK